MIDCSLHGSMMSKHKVPTSFRPPSLRPQVVDFPIYWWWNWVVVTGTWLDYFPIYWECHHPKWRTHIFQRGRFTTNQVTTFTRSGPPWRQLGTICLGCAASVPRFADALKDKTVPEEVQKAQCWARRHAKHSENSARCRLTNHQWGVKQVFPIIPIESIGTVC